VKKLFDSACDTESDRPACAFGIKEHAAADGETVGGVCCNVIPEVFSGADGDADATGGFVIDLGTNADQGIAIAFAILYFFRGMDRIEIGRLYVAAVIGCLGEAAEREFANASDFPLNAKPKRAVGKICRNAIAGLISAY